MHFPSKLYGCLALSLLGPLTVSGHAYVMGANNNGMPLAYFINPNQDRSQFAGTIDGNLVCPGRNLGSLPDQNVKNFVECFKASRKYKNIDEMIKERTIFKPNATASCGLGSEGGPKILINDSLLVGVATFGLEHAGSCATFCDGELVQASWECDKAYPQKPAEIPIDCEKCKNAKLLRFVWIAMQTAVWQVYTNCLPIAGLGKCTPGKKVLREGIENAGASDNTSQKPVPSPALSVYPTPLVIADPTSMPVKPATKPASAPEPVTPLPATPAPAYSPESKDQYLTPLIPDNTNPTNPPEASKCSIRR